MSELRGVGIGLGVAQGVVVRMTEALPAPENTPSTQGIDCLLYTSPSPRD